MVAGAPRIAATLRRNWDAGLEGTAAQLPNGGVARLLEWAVTPPDPEGGIPSALARVLAAALVAAGPVAFRLFDAAGLPDGAVVVHQPPGSGRSWLHRGPASVAVAVTGDAAVAAALFEQGWAMQDQLAFVLAPGVAAPPPALHEPQDLAGSLWPAGVIHICAPATDGAAAMLASVDATAAMRLCSEFAGRCAAAGVAFTEASGRR